MLPGLPANLHTQKTLVDTVAMGRYAQIEACCRRVGSGEGRIIECLNSHSESVNAAGNPVIKNVFE